MRALTLLLLAAVPTARADDLFVLQGEVFPTLHKLNPATGAVLESHQVTGHEALFGGLAAHPSGQLFSIDGYNDANSDRLFRIDPATGTGTVVGETRFNWNFRCVCLNPVSGVLFGATDNGLYTFDTTTGEATLVANISGSPNLDQLTAFAISPTGQAFITDIGDTDLFSLSLQTGQVTWIGAIGASGNWFSDLAFDSAGVLHGARLNGGVYTIDTATAVQAFEFSGTYTGLVFTGSTPSICYPNCDNSTGTPQLTANDFSCFLNSYVNGSSYADCDGIGGLTANDFTCFLTSYVNGCS
jgi:WD40 repeat protein